jgi:sucrose phosphorylase
MQLLARTRVGRDINRHCYSRGEIDLAIERPVVARLFELIRLRNSHAAFNGEFHMAPSPDETIDLRWRNGEEFASLYIDFRTCGHSLSYSRNGRSEHFSLTTAADAEQPVAAPPR